MAVLYGTLLLGGLSSRWGMSEQGVGLEVAGTPPALLVVGTLVAACRPAEAAEMVVAVS